MVLIRDYRREDFDTLWQIDQKCFAPGIAYSRIELALFMRRAGSFTLVADRAGGNARPGASSIVGFLVGESNRRGVGHVITIDVLEGSRRSGAGSLLLTVAEGRFRAAGCRGVVLETAVDNTSALAFYERHQYAVTKTIPGYYANGADALVLRKDLAAEGGSA
jgi:ribosomal-protein-alanine N-acetyltransferase